MTIRFETFNRLILEQNAGFGQKRSRCTYSGFLYFQLWQCQPRFYCTAFPLVFHTLPARNEEFILSWDELSYSPLTSVHILCYQPPCFNCLYLAIIFKLPATNILLQHWNHMIISGRRISPVLSQPGGK